MLWVCGEIWSGFTSKDFEDGPLVWTSMNKAMSSDKARTFPPVDADIPQLSTIETFPVIPIQISRARPVGYRNIGGLASSFIDRLKDVQLLSIFDLGDLLTELQKRPLRGTEETIAFVEWGSIQCLPLVIILV